MMVNFKNRLHKEKGQAFAIVLCLLAIGGLTIAVSLNHISTNLKGTRIVTENMKGIYAADAGVESVLWSLSRSLPPPTQLAENLNQMSVNITTENRGIYTFYLDELVNCVHYEWLDVFGNMTWDTTEGAYKYTITVVWQIPGGEHVVHLDQVGARVPVGYTYDNFSANRFPNNISFSEPAARQDPSGAWLLNWTTSPPRPSISGHDPIATQSFYLSGSGNITGDYVWVVAEEQDIGAIGEIVGIRYLITSIARELHDNRIIAKIDADIIKRDDGSIFIISWKVSK